LEWRNMECIFGPNDLTVFFILINWRVVLDICTLLVCFLLSEPFLSLLSTFTASASQLSSKSYQYVTRGLVQVSAKYFGLADCKLEWKFLGFVTKPGTASISN
jgi:hypothetical protein